MNASSRTTRSIDTLILGAGPAGLAAAYVLAKAGRKPVILERAKAVGGLMRSVNRGDFVVDIGRKELYNRLARVDRLWAEVLGDEYREYPHRGGILYKGHIVEISKSFRGFRRGMPWHMFAGCLWDLLASRARGNGRTPANLEEYFYRKRGRRLTQIVSQGFQEKLSGVAWADVPLPEDFVDRADATFLHTFRGLVSRTFAKMEANTAEGVWKHPARGTGQICELLERHILGNGGEILLEAGLVNIECAGNRVKNITTDVAGETRNYQVEHLVSSIPSEHLLKLLLKDRFDELDASVKNPPSSRRVIVLIYLFLNEAPRFPHAWLNVTCPDTRMGRITNYSGLEGRMVPPGKTCLCCEFYVTKEDALLAKKDDELVDLALSECARYKLVDPSKRFDSMVFRLPGADASQNRHNWMNSMRHGLLEVLRPYSNVFYVARTDLDIATLAGIEAAEAIINGDRAAFDLHFDPAQLPIRSAKKAFEFRNPLEQQMPPGS